MRAGIRGPAHRTTLGAAQPGPDGISSPTLACRLACPPLLRAEAPLLGSPSPSPSPQLHPGPQNNR